jgi:hypothetical protein
MAAPGCTIAVEASCIAGKTETTELDVESAPLSASAASRLIFSREVGLSELTSRKRYLATHNGTWVALANVSADLNLSTTTRGIKNSRAKRSASRSAFAWSLDKILLVREERKNVCA